MLRKSKAMFNVKITTIEKPNKLSPCERKFTEELIGASAEYAYNYISKNVLDVPKKKWSSIGEYWEECWKPTGDLYVDESDSVVKSMFDRLTKAYEFWVEEKTGEALKSWFDSNSPSFEILYENINVVVTREAD